jgi:CO/xanthine dehydrogenase Mo-binding subunit
MSTSPQIGLPRVAPNLRTKGHAFGILVTSPCPHGFLKGTNADTLRSMRGVLGVWTGADLQAANCEPIAPVLDLSVDPRTAIRTPARYWLATDRVRHIGEPVALIVAETIAEARTAANALLIDIEPLHIAPDPRAAASLGAPSLFDDATDNICCEFYAGDYTETMRAFDEASHIVRLRFVGDRSDDLGFEERRGLAEFVSRQLGRTVFLTDDMSSVQLSCAYDFDGELALDEKGIFLALRVRGYVSAGAFLEDATPIKQARDLSRKGTTVYGIPFVEVANKVLFTTTLPANTRTSADQVETAYMIERLIDQAARDLDIDRVELRKRNSVRPELGALLDRAIVAADAIGFFGRTAESEKHGRLRGLGVGAFEEEAALAPSFGVGVAEVEIDPETGLIAVVRRILVSAAGDITVLPRVGDRLEIQGLTYSGDARAKALLANAIVDALGGRHVDFPSMPERIWGAVHTSTPMLGLY